MLTVEHRIDFTARHEMPGLPEWHPCARGDEHTYALVVELHGLPDDAIEPVSMTLREAVATLERDANGAWLPDLGGELGVRAGERDLARWAHRWIAERLPPVAGSPSYHHLAVWVDQSGNELLTVSRGDAVEPVETCRLLGKRGVSATPATGTGPGSPH